MSQTVNAEGPVYICPRCGRRWVGDLVPHFQQEGRCSGCRMDEMFPRTRGLTKPERIEKADLTGDPPKPSVSHPTREAWDHLQALAEEDHNMLKAEIERLRTAMQAAYDALHDDNDADGAERMLRVALRGSGTGDGMP